MFGSTELSVSHTFGFIPSVSENLSVANQLELAFLWVCGEQDSETVLIFQQYDEHNTLNGTMHIRQDSNKMYLY